MWRRALLGGVAATAGGATALVAYYEHDSNSRWEQKLMRVCKADLTNLNQRPTRQIPDRQEMINLMQSNEEYDVLIIGGGATGAGIILDAQTRGLKTAIVEYDDFSSGTSSRSTKLIHGGVRYLQAAIMKLDIEQYRMVKEALHERANLLEIAPHLAYPLPIMLPVYKWWQLPYFYSGIKMYDLVSGKRVLKHSYVIGKKSTLDLFPMLKKDKLVGAIIYYDGQHDDARMNISIVLTAIRHGAHALNHAQVTDLIKNEAGDVKGAWIEDRLTGKKWQVRAKAVVNATGPYMDTIRKMDNPDVRELCIPSVGTHIVLPGYYSPVNTGLLDPATTDGRVVFFLPWQKMTVAGTTDSPSPITHSPAPSEKDINFILDEIKHYLSPEINVRRGDVMSAWAGLRPLVRDPNKADTKSLARNHIIEVSNSNLISVGGGKWTTYRQMAEDVISTVLKTNPDIKPARDCVTTGLLLEGAHEWHPLMYIRLVQDFGIEEEVSQHLASTYGDRAFSVAKLCKPTGKRWPLAGTRLHQEFPYLEAEIRYACRREMAATAIDIIARRLRLAFLNTHAATEALPKIVEIMAEELKWSRTEKEKQLKEALQFIDVEMGQSARSKAIMETSINLTHDEVKIAKKKFHQLDTKGNGIITLNDLRRHFKERGEKLDETTLHELLNEVDLDKNGEVNLVEWLQLYSGMKGGQISQNRLAKYLSDDDTTDSGKISVNRSGGGL